MEKPTVNVFGTFGYHKGYVKDKYTYPVLMIDRITKEEKEKIRAAVKPLTTDREAQKLIGQNGWSYQTLDQSGRVGVLKYRGVEVALFLKRQMTEERPGVGDPLPERILQDPANLWQRLDIMGPSAKQANMFIKNKIDRLTEKETLLESRCENLQRLVDSLETTVSKQQALIEDLKKRGGKCGEGK